MIRKDFKLYFICFRSKIPTDSDNTFIKNSNIQNAAECVLCFFTEKLERRLKLCLCLEQRTVMMSDTLQMPPIVSTFNYRG